MSSWIGEAIIFDKLFKQLGKQRIRKGIISAFKYLKGCHGENRILILCCSKARTRIKSWKLKKADSDSMQEGNFIHLCCPVTITAAS